MKKKKKLPGRREIEEMKEQKETIDKELEKEWKKDKVLEGHEEKKKAYSYENKLLHRAHMKKNFIKTTQLGHVRGKFTHIKRNRHGRMAGTQTP